MSDYTNTFTESTGDSIDTTDFSTEFSAIETASATKLDAANGTATDLTFTSSSATINGQTAHGMVFLDDAQLLASATTADAGGSGDWNTIDMSVQYAQAATDGAVAALVRVHIDSINNAGATCNIDVYARKKGLSGAVDVKWQAGDSLFSDVNNTSVRAIYTAETTVALDSNSDFEYQVVSTASSSRTVRFYLVGYYV